MAGDAVAEKADDPLFKICGGAGWSFEAEVFRMAGFEQAKNAFENDFAREAVSVGLERVRGEDAVHVNDGFAFVLGKLAGQEPVDEVLHVGISQVKPVACAVAKEAVVAVSGADDAAGLGFFLDDKVILAEMVGAGKAGEASAEDERRVVVHDFNF